MKSTLQPYELTLESSATSNFIQVHRDKSGQDVQYLVSFTREANGEVKKSANFVSNSAVGRFLLEARYFKGSSTTPDSKDLFQYQGITPDKFAYEAKSLRFVIIHSTTRSPYKSASETTYEFLGASSVDVGPCRFATLKAKTSALSVSQDTKIPVANVRTITDYSPELRLHLRRNTQVEQEGGITWFTETATAIKTDFTPIQ